MNVTAIEVRWGVNNTRATCRHVLGDDDQPVCGQSRGRFETLEYVVATADGDPFLLRALLTGLPVCGRCQPIARMRGLL